MIPINKADITLEPWTSPMNASGYEVIEGDPQVSGHYYFGGRTSKISLGIWACTEGTFKCTESANELQTLMEGELKLHREDGDIVHLLPGDSVYTEQGEVVIWEIIKPVKKVFYNNKVE